MVRVQARTEAQGVLCESFEPVAGAGYAGGGPAQDGGSARGVRSKPGGVCGGWWIVPGFVDGWLYRGGILVCVTRWGARLGPPWRGGQRGGEGGATWRVHRCGVAGAPVREYNVSAGAVGNGSARE